MISEREIIISLVSNDCIRKSDAIVLLEGDGFNRLRKAARLYKKGLAERIIFSGGAIDKNYGSYPFEEVLPRLLQMGIPEEAIIFEKKSRHTQEQAREVIILAIEKGWKRLILVASHEHQCRAYLTFLREIIDTHCGILLYNAPVRNLLWFSESKWGVRFDRLKAEFARMETYLKKGHLATFQEAIEYHKWKESAR